jgi:hypothetical protein
MSGGREAGALVDRGAAQCRGATEIAAEQQVPQL